MASIFGSEKDILDLEIYFKKHEVRNYILHLNPAEYETLYVRSHFISASEDFKARLHENTFSSAVHQRPHLTNDSAEPVVQCQVDIRIPKRFAMDAPDVACFLLICSPEGPRKPDFLAARGERGVARLRGRLISRHDILGVS